jgi:hypothetical protein
MPGLANAWFRVLGRTISGLHGWGNDSEVWMHTNGVSGDSVPMPLGFNVVFEVVKFTFAFCCQHGSAMVAGSL